MLVALSARLLAFVGRLPLAPFFSWWWRRSALPLALAVRGRWVEEEIEALWCVASRTYVHNGLLRPVPLEKAIERRVP